MYPISQTVKAMLDSNYKQVIRIRMDTENETYNLTENDLISNSFSVDRYSITGNRIEVGTACAGECSFKIKNYDGAWNDVKFEGAQLYVRIGVADWSTYQSEQDINWIPCGYFTVDAPVKNNSILSVVSLDRMAKLDKPVVWAQLSSASTVLLLVNRICELCDVLLADGTAVAGLPNANYQIVLPTDQELTYRNLLQAACMLMGVCAFFNENGLLVLKWYTSTSVSIDETKRYSHEIYENDISITGVYFKREISSESVEEYLSGTNDYAIDISDNPLLGENVQGVVTALGTALVGFTYRPVRATVKPAPYLYPMDTITFLKAGTSYSCIVSNVTYGVNSNTVIEGKGETDTDNGYATYGNFNAVQSKVVEYAKKKVDKEINDRTTLLMNLNEMVMNSLGLYETTMAVSGGGYQYYFHDASTLANSTIIYTFDANGFAWTDDWNDGSPVWHYGITRDGNAIINMLSAYKISADIITAGTMRAVNLIFGTEPNTTELRTNDASTGALFEGAGVMQFETKGEFYTSNLDTNDDEANRIKLTNSSTESSAELYNRFNDFTANYLDLSATASVNQLMLRNYPTGSGLQANQTELYSGTTNYIDFRNYEYGYVTSTQGVKQANRMTLTSSSTENNFTVGNRVFGAETSSGNSITANNIVLKSTNSGSSELWLQNYDSAGTRKNYLLLRCNSSDNQIWLDNTASSGGRQFIKMSNDGLELYSTNDIFINPAGNASNLKVWVRAGGTTGYLSGVSMDVLFGNFYVTIAHGLIVSVRQA